MDWPDTGSEFMDWPDTDSEFGGHAAPHAARPRGRWAAVPCRAWPAHALPTGQQRFVPLAPLNPMDSTDTSGEFMDWPDTDSEFGGHAAPHAARPRGRWTAGLGRAWPAHTLPTGQQRFVTPAPRNPMDSTDTSSEFMGLATTPRRTLLGRQGLWAAGPGRALPTGQQHFVPPASHNPMD
ncbi:unnamed protein product [Prorocentrum cordatum]|uniref:Uncharacterized protein n=1 Tax=Prorocentrum cordatum TaxID=2364126 RepID=A0ABN9XM10_9DINO|nr:unnamed protein product [Polarella glacialis]